MPMVNMISGGLHAGGNLDFQDFLILPVGAECYRQALEWTVAVYRRLGQLLSRMGFEGHLVGDEGGYGPRLRTNSEAVEFIVAAIRAAGLRPGEDVALGLDVASSQFYRDGQYRLTAGSDDESWLSADEFIDLLASWVETYPIVSIEDGLDEDDWDGWRLLRERLGDKVQLVGDDLLVTNPAFVKRGIEEQAANSVLVKVNQIGSLTETFDAVMMAHRANWTTMISHRSGETEDVTIADIAVAVNAGQIKTGAPARSDRVAKYNQLLRIEEELGDAARYAGAAAFPRAG
jgi:enolase